jgi:hypothetical protein
VVRFDNDFAHVFLCSLAGMTGVMFRHPADVHSEAGYFSFYAKIKVFSVMCITPGALG